MRCALTLLVGVGLLACGSEDGEGGQGGSAGASSGGAGGNIAVGGTGGATDGAAGNAGGGASGATGGTAGVPAGGGGAASGPCVADPDCACGKVCKSGACVPDDCSAQVCPAGRTCACENGVLAIDGKTGQKWAKLGDPDVVLRRRPMTAADDGTTLELRNYRVHDVTNQKALHVTLAASDGTFAAMYKDVRIRCIEIEKVYRDAVGAAAGLHMDYIKIDGAQAGKPPAQVLLEDVNVHDGNVYSLISDASIDNLVLRRLKHVNTQGALQIGGQNVGHINELWIDQSPDLHIALIDAKIDHITVTKSPGVTGTEAKKDAIVMKYDAESCPNRALGTKECCESGGKSCP